MIVKFEDVEYRIRWHYSETNSTMCTISKVITKTLEESVSIGTCNVPTFDKFCREAGRKLSLKRAFQKYSITMKISSDKEWSDFYKFKCAIWETYRTMTKVPRWRNPSKLDINELIKYLTEKLNINCSGLININDGHNGVLMRGPYAGYSVRQLIELVARSRNKTIKYID